MTRAAITVEQVRALLAPHGTLRAQPASDWQGEFALPEMIVRFYEQVGPSGPWINDRVGHATLTIPTAGNPFSLPPLARLWELQAGYRWHGHTSERLTDWPDHWLVVADQGGDPFIFDLRSGAIQFALHGGGAWEDDDPLFPDLLTMAACLGTVGAVWNEAGDDVFAEDYSVKPRYREQLIVALTPLIGADGAVNFADLFGW